MSDKELHYNYVLRLIRNAVGDGNFSINHLINDNGLLPDVSEYELREAINWAIRGGVIVSKSGDEDKIPQLSFSKETISDALSEKVDISVTSPKLYSNSIGELAKKNEFISTYFAFKELITSANHVIRISSPFLQRNVGGENSIPEFEEILLSAFRRGCRLIILSREVSSKRASDLGWIVT